MRPHTTRFDQVSNEKLTLFLSISWKLDEKIVPMPRRSMQSSSFPPEIVKLWPSLGCLERYCARPVFMCICSPGTILLLVSLRNWWDRDCPRVFPVIFGKQNDIRCVLRNIYHPRAERGGLSPVYTRKVRQFLVTSQNKPVSTKLQNLNT